MPQNKYEIQHENNCVFVLVVYTFSSLGYSKSRGKFFHLELKP